MCPTTIGTVTCPGNATGLKIVNKQITRRRKKIKMKQNNQVHKEGHRKINDIIRLFMYVCAFVYEFTSILF